MWSRMFAWTLDARSGRSLFAAYSARFFEPVAMLTLIAGTAFLMWLSHYITRRGIANGLLLVFIAGILSGLPDIAGELRAQPFPTVLTLALIVAGPRGSRVDIRAVSAG